MHKQGITGAIVAVGMAATLAALWPVANRTGNGSDPSWDDVPTVGSDPFATAAARDLWAECVTANLTGDGRGGDADMARCDRLYTEVTGDDTTLWLWCPGAPEQGGCHAETGPLPEPEPAPEQPTVSHGGNTEPQVTEPTPEPTPTDTGPCAIYGDDTPERSACDDAKESAADDGGEVGADEWPNGTEPPPSDPSTVGPAPEVTQ